jgi:hypothetical protein
MTWMSSKARVTAEDDVGLARLAARFSQPRLDGSIVA